MPFTLKRRLADGSIVSQTISITEAFRITKPKVKVLSKPAAPTPNIDVPVSQSDAPAPSKEETSSNPSFNEAETCQLRLLKTSGKTWRQIQEIMNRDLDDIKHHWREINKGSIQNQSSSGGDTSTTTTITTNDTTNTTDNTTSPKANNQDQQGKQPKKKRKKKDKEVKNKSPEELKQIAEAKRTAGLKRQAELKAQRIAAEVAADLAKDEEDNNKRNRLTRTSSLTSSTGSTTSKSSCSSSTLKPSLSTTPKKSRRERKVSFLLPIPFQPTRPPPPRRPSNEASNEAITVITEAIVVAVKDIARKMNLYPPTSLATGGEPEQKYIGVSSRFYDKTGQRILPGDIKKIVEKR